MAASPRRARQSGANSFQFFRMMLRSTVCILLCTIVAGLAQEAAAYSTSPALISGRTNRDGGAGCAGACHGGVAADGTMTVQIAGPAMLAIGATALYSVTATKASLGAAVKMGTAIAASDSPTPLAAASTALDLNAPTGELIHNANLGSLNQTNSGGSATYYFRYTIPTSAAAGSTHTLYSVARLGFSGAWNHAPNYTVTAILGVPQAPVIGTATSGNATATVTFSPPSSNGGSAITGYTVIANPSAGMDSNAGTTGLSHVVTGLINGTTYTFTVIANNVIGASAASAASNSVTPGTVPSAPTGVAASPGNAVATVTFSASAVNGGAAISGYTVTSNPAGGIDAQAGTTALNHFITGLANFTAYTFTATAANSFGNSVASAPSNSVTPLPLPTAPLNVSATAGNTQATVTFSPPASNGGSAIIGYTVASNPLGGIDSNIGTTSLSHVITGLTNGNNYTFTVTATNMTGAGPPSAASVSVVPSALPGAPTGLTAVAANAAAAVTFVAPVNNGGSSISGYTVISIPAGGIDNHADTANLTHTITGLANGTAYGFSVTATNVNGTGPASAISASVTPSRGNSPDVLWTRVLARGIVANLGCNKPAASRGPAIDASGNVFVNGCSLLDAGADVVTHKIDGINGNVLWTATYTNLPVGSFPTMSGLAVDGAGNVVMTTTIRDSAFKNSIRTIKYNGATGAEMWNVGYASASGDESNFDIGLDASGNVFVTGDGGNSMRTIKFNGSTGAEMWRANTAGYPYAQAIDAVGNIVVTGYIYKGGSDRDFSTVKYNGTTGAVMWNVTYNSVIASSYDNALAIAIDASNNVVVTGITGISSQIIKYSGASGAELWNVASSLPDHETLAVAIDAAGDVLLVGSSKVAGGNYDIRTVKRSGTTGAEIWSKSYNGTANGADFGAAVAIDSNGHVIVTGTSKDAVGDGNLRVIEYHGITGAVLWNHAYIGPDFYDAGYRVAIGSGNSVYVIGALDTLDRANRSAVVVQKIAGISRPDAPTILGATGGDAQITVSFSAPAFDGGATVIYAANCSGITASGGASPIIVTGLSNGTSYGCTVTASNSAGSGPSSTILSATPASALTLLSVLSRKIHTGVGAFDIDVVATPLTVEPRIIGGGHMIVFQFNTPISIAGTVSAVDAVSATPVTNVTSAIAGNDVVVTLTSVADNKRIRITINGVNGASTSVSATVGFLLGDVNNTGSVTASDISGVKARSGQPTTAANFRFDINTTGAINSSDISSVKARSGLVLP